LATLVQEGLATLAPEAGFTRVLGAALTLVPAVELTPDREVVFTLAPAVELTPDREVVFTLAPAAALTPDREVAPTRVLGVVPTPVLGDLAMLGLAGSLMTNGTALLRTANDAKSICGRFLVPQPVSRTHIL